MPKDRRPHMRLITAVPQTPCSQPRDGNGTPSGARCSPLTQFRICGMRQSLLIRPVCWPPGHFLSPPHCNHALAPNARGCSHLEATHPASHLCPRLCSAHLRILSPPRYAERPQHEAVARGSRSLSAAKSSLPAQRRLGRGGNSIPDC